ncbi:MAG TPA: HAD family hydrolase [Nocardioidaceae bacterium]|nr:HAD family hydrolase [Nocardioidaceae bacterium]
MAVDAVIFDWGGTLTPWRTIDFAEESAALAQACVPSGVHSGDPEEAAAALLAANGTVWERSRDEHRSATIADIFAAAGLTHDASLLQPYRDFWEPRTLTDPDVPALFDRLRADGIRIGVLSNTVWPREWHEGFFERDGVLHLLDGAVYTSEIPWTKPHPEAFGAAMAAVGVDDPARCVFVGDRLFDDIYGATAVGMKAVHVPHSDVPAAQHGHTNGQPDAVIQRLADLPDVIAPWR